MVKGSSINNKSMPIVTRVDWLKSSNLCDRLVKERRVLSNVKARALGLICAKVDSLDNLELITVLSFSNITDIIRVVLVYRQ